MTDLAEKLKQVYNQHGVAPKTGEPEEIVEIIEKGTEYYLKNYALEKYLETMLGLAIGHRFWVTCVEDQPSASKSEELPQWLMEMYHLWYDRPAKRHRIQYVSKKMLREKILERVNTKNRFCSIITKEVVLEYQLQKRFTPVQADENLFIKIFNQYVDIGENIEKQRTFKVFTNELERILTEYYHERKLIGTYFE